MVVRNIFKRILYREKYDSATYINYLNKLGTSIDKSSWIVAPNKILIDVTRPYLITIGKNVVLTEGVAILTHGFDWIVLRTKYGDVLGSAGKINIGDNVFVGVHSIILKGVTIGNNVIIGAGSVVCKDIPDDCVAVGNPCKVICSLSKYYEKRREAQYEEAKIMALSYFRRYGRWPEESMFSEFFWLFKDREEIIIDSGYKRKMNYGADEIIRKLVMERYMNSQPMFHSFNEFINTIIKENQ